MQIVGLRFQMGQTSASSVEKVRYNSLTSARNAHLFILTTSGLPQVLLRHRRTDLDAKVDDANCLFVALLMSSFLSINFA